MRLLAVPVLVASALCAQGLPDAESLIKQRDEAMKTRRSVQFTVQMTMDMTREGLPSKTVSESSVAYVNPGKMRVDSQSQGVGFVIVSDGESTWMYNPRAKQYTRRPAALGRSAMVSAMGVHLPDISKVASTVKTLRAESITTDGQKHDCWVVERTLGKLDIPGQQGGPDAQVLDYVATYWIDKKLPIDLKVVVSMTLQIMGQAVQVRQAMVTKNLQIDQPVPDSLFAFTPPADAKEVPELSGSTLPKTDLAGQEASGFQVKDLDGKEYSLEALRGKPVLLDFWATWCMPCRRSLPVLSKLYEEYKGQGLVVLAVDVGEDRAAVEAFLKTAPAPYPEILGGESGIVTAYQANAFPTFVLIGRDGKIAANQIGFAGEAALRGMLEKAALTQPRP